MCFSIFTHLFCRLRYINNCTFTLSVLKKTWCFISVRLGLCPLCVLSLGAPHTKLSPTARPCLSEGKWQNKEPYETSGGDFCTSSGVTYVTLEELWDAFFAQRKSLPTCSFLFACTAFLTLWITKHSLDCWIFFHTPLISRQYTRCHTSFCLLFSTLSVIFHQSHFLFSLLLET